VVRLGKITPSSLLRHDRSLPGLPFGMPHLQELYASQKLSLLQMLVGTVAFNTLAIIEPTDSSALAIWALGYVFQGLGMGIAFIVSLNPLCHCVFPLIIIQFITVHFYRAIRYGFHRYVDHVCWYISNPVHLSRGAAASSTFISVGPPGNSQPYSQCCKTQSFDRLYRLDHTTAWFLGKEDVNKILSIGEIPN